VEQTSVLKGFAIVVADRGFVYVGEVEHDGNWCVVKNAQNIRRWGTTRGLGELAGSGPTENTKIDPTGTVRIPASSVVSLIDTRAELWTKN
jgi:hypothetical protein